MVMDIAEQELEALLKVPGALKIITADPSPEWRDSMLDRAKHTRPNTDPRYFVLHDVVRIEKRIRQKNGKDQTALRAYTAEGDYCTAADDFGAPNAIPPRPPESAGVILLRRLREWRE